MCRKHHRRMRQRRIPNREDLLRSLEERQKDLEQEIADIHDLVRRLRDESASRAAVRARPRDLRNAIRAPALARAAGVRPERSDPGWPPSSSSCSSPFELTPLLPSILWSPAKSEKRPPASSTITCTAARSHSLTPIASTAAVDGAFGDEHVRPEIAEAAGVPRASRERRHVVLDRERENCLLDGGDRRDVHRFAVRECTRPALGPPTASKRRSGDDADSHDRVLLEGDQRRPHRDPPRVVARPVDRVDDPATRAGADRASLLTEDGVVRPFLREHLPNLRLDEAIGLGHGRQVGLGIDREARAKPRQRDRVGRRRRVGARARGQGSRPTLALPARDLERRTYDFEGDRRRPCHPRRADLRCVQSADAVVPDAGAELQRRRRRVGQDGASRAPGVLRARPLDLVAGGADDRPPRDERSRVDDRATAGLREQRGPSATGRTRTAFPRR